MMRIMVVCVTLLLASFLLAKDACYKAMGKDICFSRHNADTIIGINGNPLKLTGEVGIRFNNNVTEKARTALIKRFGLISVLSYDNWPVYIKVKVPNGIDPFDIAKALNGTGLVKWAQPVWLERSDLLSTTPNDTYYTEQTWHHEMIHSPEAWDITTGDPRAVIAIIDCGVATQHVDLMPNILPGKSFVPTESSVDPNMNSVIGYQMAHGTCVAGTAAAKGNNGIGVAGVCWDCSILPIKYDSVQIDIPADRKLNAMKWAVDNGAWVINNSWGIAPDHTTQGSTITCIEVAADNYTAESVDYAAKNGRGGRGTVIFFAGGNSACSTDLNANFQTDTFVKVAALNATGAAASYSEWGPAIDIAAPAGYDIGIDNRGLATTDAFEAGKGWNPGLPMAPADLQDQAYTKFFYGTSGATPQVAAAVAMMLSVAPYLTAAEAIACMKKSASAPTKPCSQGDNSLCYGAGILNVEAMVKNAKSGACGGTPECKTGEANTCGEGKYCWNGICAEGEATTDDDVMADEGDVPDQSELPDNDTIINDTVITPDSSSAKDADTAVQIDNNGNTADNTTISDEDTANSNSGGCGCAVIY